MTSGNSLLAQGVIWFDNRFLPDPPDRLVRDISGEPIVGTNFIAQLLYETSPGSFTAHPDVATFQPETTQFPGTWMRGFRTLTGAGGPYFPGAPNYIPVRIQIRAWDGGFGATPLSFDEAIIAGNQWGASQVFTYVEARRDPPDPFVDRFMWEFQGFQLVPEPTTWALLMLGTGCLLWRYRRRE